MAALPIDYATRPPPPPPPPPLRPRQKRAALAACVVLAVLAAFTCCHIERLNQLAGGTLPRQWEGKWRSSLVSEQAWRRGHASQTMDFTLLTRPLTPAESVIMQAWMARMRANNELRDAVGTWGLAQYLVVFLGAMLAIGVAVDQQFSPAWRKVGIACLAVHLTAGAVAVHRGYLTSVAD